MTDLHERGLDEEVAVLVWGEFGRTPRINDVQGRDQAGEPLLDAVVVVAVVAHAGAMPTH